MQKMPDFNIIDFIEAMREKALRDLHHNNYAYLSLKEEENNLYELTEEILDGIEKDDREIMLRYLSIHDTIQGQESEHLYHAGYDDCISLLKNLGVL
jgi:hypothetical protein